jgi:hypothetical protein
MNTNAFIPAFPTWIKDDAMIPGMNLRDYFAAAVLPAMYDQPISYAAIAQSAYNMADAMLIARKK